MVTNKIDRNDLMGCYKAMEVDNLLFNKRVMQLYSLSTLNDINDIKYTSNKLF